MKILPIQNDKHNFNSFGAKKPNTYVSKKMASLVVDIDYITKDVLQNRPLKEKDMIKENAKKENSFLSESKISDIDNLLKEKGITYCQAVDNMINIAFGRNNGFFRIATVIKLDSNQAKEYIFKTLLSDSAAFGGLTNYQQMVARLKRQDIINKGLKIHTYELNNNIPLHKKEVAASNIGSSINKDISVKDVFFINNDIFYYDIPSKTAYSANIDNQSEFVKPKLRFCTFKTNSNGQAIGYKTSDWDLYARNYIEKEYIEQQEPSTKLPSVVSLDNNKDFAEAFRFGNAKKDDRLSKAIPIVKKHLSDKANIDVTEEKLQLIKFFNKDNRITRRIGYYDSTTGRSIIYNDEGKYMYQLEYNKDPFGNITSSTKL